MPAQQHTYDQVADALLEWMDDMAEQITASFAEGRATPGNATLTRVQQLDYYRRRFFNEDGTPNAGGRTETMNRVGPDGYQAICRALHDEMVATGRTPATEAVMLGHPAPPPPSMLAPPEGPPPPLALAPPAPQEVAGGPAVLA